jgi:hypothetical protein
MQQRTASTAHSQSQRSMTAWAKRATTSILCGPSQMHGRHFLQRAKHTNPEYPTRVRGDRICAAKAVTPLNMLTSDMCTDGAPL